MMTLGGCSAFRGLGRPEVGSRRLVPEAAPSVRFWGVGRGTLKGMAELDIAVLGELEVRVGDHDRTPRGRMPRAVFSLLVARLGSPMSTDALIEAVWNGSPPKSARSSLRVHISRIREAIDRPELLVTGERGYRLQTDPHAVDAYRFERGVREGRRMLEARNHRTAERVLRGALQEWRGDPYADAATLDAIQPEVARLEALKRAAEVHLAEAGMELAGSSCDIAALEMLVHRDPLDERRWGLLMKGLYRNGRQADALDAFRRASATLGEALGLEPGPDLRELEEQILLHDPALQPIDATQTITLPGFATSLVGRSETASTVAKRLVEHRLLTVTGLGGIGKTRLAVAAAQAALADHADGAVFVALDPVTDAALVPDAIGAHLGLPSVGNPTEALVRHLRDREIVLVLDNCEHVLDEVAELVNTLMSACPRVGFLCTSRVPLGLSAETLFPVSPLDVPPRDLEFATPAELLQYESIALFCERARLAHAEFTLDAESGPVVAEVVRRLAGIPLSIEIAAAKCDLLTPTDILDRLDVTPHRMVADDRDRAERHRSMADAVAWSLDLLDEGAQELFRRMAVFVGPVETDALEVVCSDESLDATAMHPSLTALARASLITVDLSADRARYSQLPPLRAVAGELLGRDMMRFRQRHLEHFATIAEEEAHYAGGPDEAASFDRLTAVLDELRAALGHAAQHDQNVGRHMCIDLGTFWIRTGRTAEGRGWVSRFLEHGAPVPWVEAAVQHLAGSLALVEQDLGSADEALSAALELRRHLETPRELGMTLSNLGGVANGRGEYERAEALFEEAHDVFAAIPFDRGAAAAQLNLGLVLLNLGSVEAAAEKLERAVDGFRRVGDRSEEAHALMRLGYALSEVGDVARAEACRQAAHEVFVELGRPPDVAYSHMVLAHHYFENGDLDRARRHGFSSARLILDEEIQRWWVPGLVELAAAIATAVGDAVQGARLFGCAGAFRRAHDVPVPDANRAFHDETRRVIEAALGRDQFVVEAEVGGTRSILGGVRAVADWR